MSPSGAISEYMTLPGGIADLTTNPKIGDIVAITGDGNIYSFPVPDRYFLTMDHG